MAKAVDMGDGHEIRKTPTGRPVLAKNRPNKFGANTRKAFLKHLSATCNVRASAKAAGCSIGAVYYWRDADAAFHDAFNRALDAGYAQLEQLLIERAKGGSNPNLLEAGDYDDLPDPADIDTELAMKLLSLHYRKVKGAPRTGGPIRRKATREETDAAILKRLQVLRIRYERGED